MVKKILIGFACIVLAGLLFFGIQLSRREDARRTAELQEINQQMDALRVRKLELESELEIAKQELEDKLSGMGTVTLLVTDLTPNLMQQILPALQQAEIPAVMALSPEHFPGNEGCIGFSEFQQRLEDGWAYCVAYDESVEFDEWYGNMSTLLEENGLTMPQVLYCDERCYTAELEEAALALNFQTIIHSGEQGLPIVDTELGNPWRIGSLRWIVSGARNRMEQAASTHGSVVLTVGQADFSESEFIAMLRLANQYYEEGTLLAATLSDARAYRERVVSQMEAARNDPENNASVRALEEELDTVNEKIQALIDGR